MQYITIFGIGILFIRLGTPNKYNLNVLRAAVFPLTESMKHSGFNTGAGG
jgi:hypothetical protein